MKQQNANGDIADAEELEEIQLSGSAGGAGGQTSSIKAIIDEAEDIDTVKKTSVFKAELTEEEQDIIKKRVALQQRQFEEYRRREISRKYAKIKLVHRHVTEKEVTIALEECQDDEVYIYMNFFIPLFCARKKNILLTGCPQSQHAPRYLFFLFYPHTFALR